MELSDTLGHSNNLVRLLSPEAADVLTPMLEPVELPVMFRLAEAGKPSASVFFPTRGVASVVGRRSDCWQEVGVFGREGAGCLSMLLEIDEVPYSVYMQVPGEGFRIAAADLAAAVSRSREVRRVMLRFIHSFHLQVSQSALANGQFNIGQRLARWILMIHDRIGGDHVGLTHEFLAGMLGVGRTGVTLALHDLERSGMISMSRKRINILDRAAMEQMTSSYYGLAEAEYSRLLGPLPELTD